jgi:transposase
MRPHHDPTVPIGVGIDTARYGHHVTFLRADLQPALPACGFAESRAGYEQLRRHLQTLAERNPGAHFHVRLDAAGQYASNLEVFLRQLPFPLTLSVGEPTRNQRYRQALFPKRKSDPVESYCAARFALVERPKATPPRSVALEELRAAASRLDAQTRQTTRLNNQLHHLLARVFPELAAEQAVLCAGWVLHLLAKYPTPQLLARARPASLTTIPYVNTERVLRLQALARETIGSLGGETAAFLVRGLVAQLRQSLDAQEELKKWMIACYRALPQQPPLTSIPGIGEATAALLTAQMVNIDRFDRPAAVVGYFGLFAEEFASGVDKEGNAKPGRRAHMSRRGNDLVRKYLWNAAKTATLHNPAVRALYRRLTDRGRRGDVAMGHCMRKLVHLVFAVWKSGSPFDPKHYPWEPAEPHAPAEPPGAGHHDGPAVATPSKPAHATADARPGPKGAAGRPGARVDFAVVRAAASMEQVLAHLGVLGELSGAGPQKRGRCPIHGEPGQGGRSFSVHLGKGIYQCFHPPCGSHGNVLDLRAAVHRLPLREAALDLARTFDLPLDGYREEEPVAGTRQRVGPRGDPQRAG